MISKDDLYWYVGRVVHVVDGDTIDVEMKLGFGVSYKSRVRLAGIDAYEKTLRGGTTPEEKEKGIKGTVFLTDLLAGREVLLKSFKDKGKYGRFVAEVFVRGDEKYSFGQCLDSGNLISVCALMVDEGFAVYKEY